MMISTIRETPHSCTNIFEAALMLVEKELNRILFNNVRGEQYDLGHQYTPGQELPNPFIDPGIAFRCETFGVWAYNYRTWDEEGALPYNFMHLPTGVQLEWRKNLNLAGLANRHVDATLAEEILESCLGTLIGIDSPSTFDEQCRYGLAENVPLFS